MNASNLLMSTLAFDRSNSKGYDDRFYHLPVLKDEICQAMGEIKDRIIIDATLGGGGHTKALLELGAKVIGIDCDEEAIEWNQRNLGEFSDHVKFIHGNFKDLSSLLEEENIKKVDGIIADIGVSSRQFDNPQRGFSFAKSGPLDMRMDQRNQLNAGIIVNTQSEKELADIFFFYGGERAGRKIAKAIVREREKRSFKTTLDLADFIGKIVPRAGKIHPATRSFQALRIAVNSELNALKAFLEQSTERLSSNGKLAVVTFHSLEARIVKQFFKERSQEFIDFPNWVKPKRNPQYCLKRVTKKPVRASQEELKINRRARSAELRVVEKLAPQIL